MTNLMHLRRCQPQGTFFYFHILLLIFNSMTAHAYQVSHDNEKIQQYIAALPASCRVLRVDKLQTQPCDTYRLRVIDHGRVKNYQFDLCDHKHPSQKWLAQR